MSNNTTAVNWRDLPSGNHPLPSGQYSVAILSVDNKPSKKGFPMATLNCEVLAPDSVVDGGVTVKVAGRKFKHWVAFTPERRQPYEDAEKLLKAHLPNGELPTPVDPTELVNTLKSVLPGQALSAVELVSEPSYYKDSLGETLVDPTTGQAKVRGYNIVMKTVCPAVSRETLGL